MKFIVLILIVRSLLMSDAVLLPEATVAVVNGKAISDDDLNREVSRLMPRTYFHASVNEKKLKNVKEKALKALIENRLMYQYAKSKGINASSSEIQEGISQIIKALGSKELLKERLKRSRMTFDDLKKEIEKDLVLRKLNDKEIVYKLTEADLKKYYKENKYKFKEPEKVKISLIYVRNNPTDPDGKAKAKKKILKAKAELDKGENFPYVAQTYSDDPSRVKGGDMGYLHRGRLDGAIEDQAFSIDVNKTSPIIERDIGYYIIRVEEKKKPNQLSFDEIKDSLKDDLKNKEEKRRKDELLKKLYSSAVIVK